MSGFTGGALDAARELGKIRTLVLLGESDVRAVFAGEVRLEGLLEARLLHFQRYGEPYAPTVGRGLQPGT